MDNSLAQFGDASKPGVLKFEAGSDLAGREGLLLEAWQIAPPGRSAPPALQRSILNSFVRLYEAWEKVAPNTGQAAQAAEWKKKLAEFDQTAAKKSNS